MIKHSNQMVKNVHQSSTTDFHLTELSYLINGNRPNCLHTLHKIFQHFHHDYKLATRLSNIILKFEDANHLNQDGWPALFVAIRFNQIRAVEFALKDARFDFNMVAGPQHFSLMHLAVLKGNYKIVELLIEKDVSLFQETIEGVKPRQLAMQSPTNLKMIRRYEQIQLSRFLENKEDLSDSDTEDVPNTLKQMGTQNNSKNQYPRLPQQPQSSINIFVKESLEKQQVGIQKLPNQFNLEMLRNPWFLERGMIKLIDNLFQQDYYLSLSMLGIMQFDNISILPQKQVEELVIALGLQLPLGKNAEFKNSTKISLPQFVQTELKDLKKQLIYQIQELRYVKQTLYQKINQIPKEMDNQDSIASLKRITSNKLQFDIRNYALFHKLWQSIQNLQFISQCTIVLFGQPFIKYQSNLLIMQQFELLNC